MFIEHSASLDLTRDLHLWSVWHGAIRVSNQWVWSNNGATAQYLNWVTTSVASSMPGESDWYWPVNEPTSLDSSLCTAIASTHWAWLMNVACEARGRRVICEYE